MRRQRRQVIAFQGERGAFSEEATRKLLGDGVDVLHDSDARSVLMVCVGVFGERVPHLE